MSVPSLTSFRPLPMRPLARVWALSFMPEIISANPLMVSLRAVCIFRKLC